MSLPNLSRPNIRTFSNIPFCPVFVLTAPCAVLRDVLRAQRGDAQTDRDLQETRCHHQTGPSLPLWRGELYQCQGHMYMHMHILHILYILHSMVTPPCSSTSSKLPWPWREPSRSRCRSWMQWCRYFIELGVDRKDKITGMILLLIL